MPDANEAVSKNWVWVMEVVYGGVLALAFQELEKELRSMNWKRRLQHVAWAAPFVVYAVYAVGAYHVLILEYPYAVTGASALRFVWDLLLAFGLTLILMSSVRAEASAFEILIGLTLWHTVAVLWHLTARYELPNVPQIPVLPHVCFVAAYWFASVVVYWTYRSKGHNDGYNSAVRGPRLRPLLAGLVLMVSIYRSWQIIGLHQARLKATSHQTTTYTSAQPDASSGHPASPSAR